MMCGSSFRKENLRFLEAITEAEKNEYRIIAMQIIHSKTVANKLKASVLMPSNSAMGIALRFKRTIKGIIIPISIKAIPHAFLKR